MKRRLYLKQWLLVSLVTTLVACASPPQNPQTMDFRHFVREFFRSEEFQRDHVDFPLAFVHYENHEPGGEVVTSFVEKDEWQHLPGPDYYRCETSCYDIVIYDNFDKVHSPSDQRVLSFEGISNGINSSLYFKLVDGQWKLVKYEQLDT